MHQVEVAEVLSLSHTHTRASTHTQHTHTHTHTTHTQHTLHADIHLISKLLFPTQ